MKYCFLLFTFLFLGFNLCAQDNDQSEKPQEVVYLENGSVIRGKVLSMEKEGEIKIEIVGGTTLTFPSNEVLEIKFEASRPTYAYRPSRIPRPYNLPGPGNYQVLVMGWAAGQAQFGFRPGFSAHYVYGRHLNQYLSLGLGVGVDVYDLVDNGEGAFQFYLDGRGYLKSSSQTFYYKLGIGYGDVFTDRWGITESTGGLYANPAIGLRCASRGRTHFIIELGATFQKAHFVEAVWDPVDGVNTRRSEIDVWFQRNTFKLGFLFSQNNEKIPVKIP